MIKLGLDSNLNYYLGNQASTQETKSTTSTGTRRLQTTNSTTIAPRPGFTNIGSIKALGKAVGVTFTGGIQGFIDATLFKVPGDAGATVNMFLPDINCIIEKKPNCFAITYEVSNIGLLLLKLFYLIIHLLLTSTSMPRNRLLLSNLIYRRFWTSYCTIRGLLSMLLMVYSRL